jgi:HPt (histidine-containing phosphotransfer) domain-containing protein
LEAEPPVHHRTQPPPPEPDQTDDPAEEPIVVEVDADFTGLVDDFLAEKRSEIDWADEARVRRDYESLRAWGHKFGGAARMYGLNELGRLGKDIEIQAEKADIEGVFATLVRLVGHLSRIEVVYVSSE